eukprot:TRINITY_DN23964_c0_g6_i1.p2 TRINITY_DN23964_c0_g6~~TRINITY_DN23964_c0_g6_i1.p2  ORF type:complete len:201 (+),score=29.11 TRINITY_DN23964_c0_g6_i1:32-604(+)
MGAQIGCCTVKNGKEKATLSPAEELKLFSHFVHDALPIKGHGLHAVFNALGGADDDKITRKEFLENLRQYNYPGRASNIFDVIDVDNQNVITKEEFLAITKANFLKRVPIHHFKTFVTKNYGDSETAFNTIDTDHSKCLTEEEFCVELKRLGYDYDPHLIYRLIDKDQSGSITIQEFKRVLDGTKRHATK